MSNTWTTFLLLLGILHGKFVTKETSSGKWLIIFVSYFEACSANLPPLFVQDMNNRVVSENTAIGTVIYTLQASDPENSSITYDLRGTDALQVDHKTGKVTVIKSLDYEVGKTRYTYLHFFKFLLIIIVR